MVAQKGAGLSADGIQQLKDDFSAQTHYGVQTDLLNRFFDETAEAMEWQLQEIAKVGQKVIMRVSPDDGDPLAYNYMVPAQTSLAYQDVADDYADRVDFHYSTPAVQLVGSAADGGVTCVIAQDKDGSYLQFNVSKGVVIATGGYGGNPELVARWLPSATSFTNGCWPADNTGDGALMAIWADAAVCPLKSKKIDIRFYGDHSGRTNIEKQPFLMVNDKGRRLGNEDATEMQQNTFVSMDPSEDGTYYMAFDADYADVLTANGQEGAVLDQDQLAEYQAGARPLLWQADTLEELAEKTGVDAQGLLATVERYNQLADAGADTDFYKDASWLYRIETGPFFTMARQYTIGGTLGAIKVTADCQAVSRADGVPIPGLYVVDNDMGGLQTGQDYVWHDYGFTLTSGTTFGYMVGRDLARS